jgi:hypothetical protein
LAIANQLATKTAKGQFKVHGQGLQEVVTDKGYHSAPGLVRLAEAGVRSYIPEKKQQRNWDGKAKEKRVYLANQRRVRGERGQRLLKRRGNFWSGRLRISTERVGCGGCMCAG